MIEIPDNLKAAMESYADQQEKIADHGTAQKIQPRIDALNEQIKELQGQLNTALQPHLEKIAELEDYIVAQVLEVGATTSHAGVTAKHRSGYERTTWDNKQMTKLCMSNPALLDLLGSARKVSEVKPSVAINYTAPDPEPIGVDHAIPF